MNKEQKLSQIAKEIEQCKICKEGKTGVAVPGEGNPDAAVVFIGEAPGKNEAKVGRPFIGRSGQLLRRLIREIGLDDEKRCLHHKSGEISAASSCPQSLCESKCRPGVHRLLLISRMDENILWSNLA